MLVVHIVHCLEIGGLETGIVNLVNAPRAGQRHAVLCMTHGGANRANLRPEVGVFELHKADGNDPRTFARLVGLLRRLRPDVVHTRNWSAFDGIMAGRLAGVGRIAHGEHGREFADPHGRNRRRKILRRLLAPLVDSFTTVSDDLRRWLIEDVRIRAAKVVRIHNGVDTARYSPGDRAEGRAALGIPSGGTVVGTVGRLNPVKGHVTLIRAFARLATADAVLVVAGDGPCRDELHQCAKTLGLGDRVRFLGERHDVPRVLRAMDVFVLPSIAEGISNTTLEAMATGLPVVATRVGGNAELVVHGTTGRLVPAENPEALAEGIAEYVSDPIRRLDHGARARARAVDVFGLDVMRDTYASLYARLGGHSPAMIHPVEPALRSDG
ncbi:MAG: sugar transferase [Candidatus Rokuibacteriota bacterium]|nr:MAG: sugar transferase [Candidatus Rokubacteria bacterium]